MGRPRLYHISLTTIERELIKKIKLKSISETIRTRCKILLEADENKHKKRQTKEIASKAGASCATVVATLKLFQEGGMVAATSLKRNQNSDVSRLKVTGDIEAKIVAKACSSAPNGYARWTLTLLTNEMKVILEEELSRATIGRTLKNNDIRPHLTEYWCIPPEADAEFVADMEDILDLYQEPYDPEAPLWCMDEKPYQLLDESRNPIPMRPGDIAKVDSEYVRNGTASVFCFIQPHTGKIVQMVEPTRTAVDWAEKIKYLVDEIAPEAKKITLAMDNLNTHSRTSLYKAFEPEEARRIARKLDIHYTPKHGSWLDIAEIAINIMTRQCLDRRIPDIDALRGELNAWCEAYNNAPSPVSWQFETEDSRIKLKRLYPDIGQYYKERDARREKKSGQAPTE